MTIISWSVWSAHLCICGGNNIADRQTSIRDQSSNCQPASSSGRVVECSSIGPAPAPVPSPNKHMQRRRRRNIISRRCRCCAIRNNCAAIRAPASVRWSRKIGPRPSVCRKEPSFLSGLLRASEEWIPESDGEADEQRLLSAADEITRGKLMIASPSPSSSSSRAAASDCCLRADSS